jgi:ABC-type molybdate transport system substrate-binding protein
VFAGNRLVIAVSNNSRAKIRSPRDLSGDIRLSVGAASVPVGSYAEHAIEQMNARFGGGFGAAVHKNIANRGQSAADVITPVALGGLDASISYASDVKAESGRVTAMAIPKWAQPQISYWIAPAQKAGDEAGGFIDYVESPAGQEALRSAGFSPVPESGTK